MTIASMPAIRDWMIEHPGWVTAPEIYRDLLCPCPDNLNPRSQGSVIVTTLGRMATKGVVERAPFDPLIIGDVKHPPIWMWQLTEEGKTHAFRPATRWADPKRPRPVRDTPDDDMMIQMLGVMQGRNLMLCATIAREMGCRDSYALAGLLRKACREGKVRRVIRRGASYFEVI